jgi:hypothetical protein
MNRPIPPLAGARFGDDWWQRGVIYQVYPRSFADSDGDGVGDLGGIIDDLDHLGPDGLGIDAIWLSPISPSPGLDLGYDVADHERVDPLFGSEEDFDRLVAEAHRRGILIALGTKDQPSYAILDDGEGQQPDRFPATFLSLLRDNKVATRADRTSVLRWTERRAAMNA